MMTLPIARTTARGYPIEKPFESLVTMRAYFSESRIRCLRCGRRFKGLAGHLWQIHGMSTDDYRELYGIPWTYGLVCAETSGIISGNSIRLVSEGVICTNDVDMSLLTRATKRPRPVVRRAINTENLSEVNKDCTGKETRRRLAAPKRGTPEYGQMAANRPQCVSSETKTRLRTIWKGKKRDGERGKMVRQ